MASLSAIITLRHKRVAFSKKEARYLKQVSINIMLNKQQKFDGIRGGPLQTVPRYQFDNDGRSTRVGSSMGPPLLPPRSLKRKLIASSSTKPESSSSGRVQQRVLASDSAADTSHDNMVTPKNRPTPLRYISSSSRGGYSGNRSMRSTSTSMVEASVILAISEGRGMARGEIGMAAVDLKHPHLVLSQFSDTLLYTHTLTKINYFNPVEIIVPHTFCEGIRPNQLYQLIKNQFPLVNMTTVQRRHFNDAAGRQHIVSLCAPQYSAVYLQVIQKFYALTAAAAVLKYVEYIQCVVFARESLKIEYHSSENTTVIDVGTATQLELVQPLVPSAGPTCCLLGVLGPTYTIGGIRALRAAILQPSCNKEFIEARLDAVQELIESDDGLMTGLQDVIKKLSDIDRILLLCMESSIQNQNLDQQSQLNQTLLLKTTMEMVPSLVECLNHAECGRLRRIKMDLENPHYKEITDRIKSIIQDDAHLEKGAMGSLQRCFAVKPEINGLLDVARRTYSELIEDIQKIVEQLSENYDLPLRLNQNVMKGFHIVLPIAPKNRVCFNVEELPPIFIQVQNSGASVSMTTEELVVLDQQAKESLKEIQNMSIIVISGLLKDLRPFMPSLYKLCEDVAELDILLALAQASSIGSYIRPDFNNYLDIRNSVHPLLDYNSQVDPVSNDIYASPEQNFTIITGPNMGGKSIYIKQIALMQIMAQLGCFVPATNAVLRLSNRIFSRIGFNDSVELNASTYVFEIKEIQHILKGLTSTSLVIIDELCRATCTEEGTSIAWAICEELIMSDAFTFFTTHFMYLTRLQELYFNVVNRHTAVTEETNDNEQTQQQRLIYKHKIELGVTKVQHYGLALAAKTNLPEETVKLAEELADLIAKNETPQVLSVQEKSAEEMLYQLNFNLRFESRRQGSENGNKVLLQQFKNDNPQLIERLRVERSRNINMPRTANNSVHSRSNIEEYSNAVSSKDTHPKSSDAISNSINQSSFALQDTETTDDPETSEPANHSETCTSVKYSDELFNFMNSSENGFVKSDKLEANPVSNKTEDAQMLIDRNNQSIDENNGINVTEDPSQDLITMHNITDENDSEMIDADALTQAIESENDSKTGSEISIDCSEDRELMIETIREINAELEMKERDVDCIILTPPELFRD